MTNSSFLGLNVRDAVNGFVVAFFGTALTGLIAILDGGRLPENEEIKAAAIVGLTAGLSYLLKNFLTNSQGQLFTKE